MARSEELLTAAFGSVSADGVLPGVMPPAAYFSQQLEKWAKEPPETNGFWTSFTFKRLACYGTVKGIDSATDPLPLR